MTVNFLTLFFGLVLLLLPRHWLRRGATFLRRVRRPVESTGGAEPWRDREPGDPHVNFQREFRKFRNYVDLLRGAAGSLALVGGAGLPAGIGIAAGAPRSASTQVMAIQAVVLMFGLLNQTVRRDKNRVSFYPPIFYLGGLSFGLIDARGAAFAFALIWAINFGLPNAQIFLTVYGILIVIFGHVFAWSGDVPAVYAGALCVVPVFLSILAKRPLTVFARKPSRA